MDFGVQLTDDENSSGNSLKFGGSDKTSSLSDLPNELIEHIYTFLNRRDQCKMSMVSRRCSNLYSQPRFWRTIKLNLPDKQYGSLSVYPEITWVAKHGAEIRHVEINFKELTDIVKRQMKPFLKNLTIHSQLDSFTFRNYGFRGSKHFLDISEAFKDFLKSQQTLTSVGFSRCNFGNVDNAEMLRVICEGNRNTLQKLDLTGFSFDPSDSDFRFFYETLLNLRTLAIDYSETYENIIIGFGEFLENKRKNGTIKRILLENISISFVYERGFYGIPSNVWLLFKEVCPTLLVDIRFTPDTVFSIDSFRYMKKHIPLRSLDFQAKICCPRYWEGFFEHLDQCGITGTLEEITVDCSFGVTYFVQQFEGFAKNCEKLKKVKLSLPFPVPILSGLLEFWTQRKPPALEDANITVTSVLTATEREKFMNLAEYFGSALQKVGLRLDLCAENVV